MASSRAQLRQMERQQRERQMVQEMLSNRNQIRFSQRIRQSLFNEDSIENPLVLYRENDENLAVIVDERFSKELQMHQREGVQKMYNIVSQYVAPPKPGIKQGFILADRQGLGKTIQTLTVVWTLLTQSPQWNESERRVEPEVKKAIIVVPKSVVSVWKNEVVKWLQPSGRTDATDWTIDAETIDDSKGKTKKREAAKEFMKPQNNKQLLILSYDTFKELVKPTEPLERNTDNVVGLIVLDEAHFIKNDLTQRHESIRNFQVNRKIALSGTPLQNNLIEYHTLIDYLQPSVLINSQRFEEEYQQPIMKYVEQKTYMHGKRMLDQLKANVAPFFLRRTINPFVNATRTDYIVCCKMNEDPEESLQLELHNMFVEAYTAVPSGSVVKKRKKQMSAFTASHFLKDLCCHPQMVYEKCRIWNSEGHPELKNLITIFEAKDFVPNEDELETVFSPKLRVLRNLLMNIQNGSNNRHDRVVVVSYYTQVLTCIEKVLLKEGFKFVRFDGTTSGKKREELIKKFNDRQRADQFIMTLSSRAGGCGISLIGANHLIMFDPDWNPANDEQVMSRIYRDGQQKDCHIYRLLTTASIEEQIFRRQIVKKLMSGAVLNDNDNDGIFNFNSTALHQSESGRLPISFEDEMNNEARVNELCVKITSEDLQTCLTHKQMECNRCDVTNRREVTPPYESSEIMRHDDSLELRLWNHHFDKDSLPTECEVLSDSWIGNNDISFVFRKKNENEEI